MAQSKIGGTKSFIHGKVGSEVYYTDHDLEGEIIQVVKSVPDTVRNPRTAAQNRGRIIMATLYKAVGALATLINHSFDGFSAGRPSLAHFFSINYELIKEDIESHPDTNYQFGLVQWKGLFARPGAYIISSGSLVLDSHIWVTFRSSWNDLRVTYQVPNSRKTIGDMKSFLNLAIGDYLTFVLIKNDGAMLYARLTYVYSGNESVVLNEASLFEAFNIEGNLPIIYLRGGSTTNFVTYWTNPYVKSSLGIILTKIQDGVAYHSESVMRVCNNVESNFTKVLASYPKGDKYYY